MKRKQFENGINMTFGSENISNYYLCFIFNLIFNKVSVHKLTNLESEKVLLKRLPLHCAFGSFVPGEKHRTWNCDTGKITVMGLLSTASETQVLLVSEARLTQSC